jgi:hypothetical protein
MDREQIEAFKRAMQEVMGDRNPSAGRSSSSGDSDGATYKERIDNLLKSSKDATDSYKRLSASLRLTNRAQYEHKEALRQANNELYDLEEALRKHRAGTALLTPLQLKEVEARRKEISSMQDRGEVFQKFTGGVEKWGKFLIGYYGAVQMATIQGVGQVMSTIQSGGSGFAIANAQMEMELNIANVHAQQLATATQMAGTAVAAIPGFASKLLGLGMVLNAESNKVQSELKTAAARLYNQVLMTGGDQLLRAYKDLTKAGVVVAGGADDIAKALQFNGVMMMTFDQFKQGVQENADALVRTGMGIGQASLQMGRVAAQLRGQKLDRQLQAMGVSVEDFMGIAASEMAYMKQGQFGRSLKDSEILQRSVEYAQSLSIINQLTGKSIRDLKEKAKANQADFAYQQEMANLPDSVRATVTKAMDTFDDEIRRSIVQTAKFGVATGDSMKLLAARFPELQVIFRDAAKSMRNGTMTPDEAIKIRTRLSSVYQTIMKDQTFGTIAASNSKLAPAINSLSSMMVEGSRFTADAVKNIKENQRQTMEDAEEAGKTGKPKNMTQMLTDIEAAGRDLTAKFQQHIIDRLPEIGTKIKASLEEANRLIEEGLGGFQRKFGGGDIPGMGEINKWLPIAIAALLAVDALKLIRWATSGRFGGGTTTTATEGGAKVEEGKTRTERFKEWFKEKNPFKGKELTGSAKDVAEMELRSKAAAAEIRQAKIATALEKAAPLLKNVNRANIGVQTLMYGYEMNQIREKKNRGEITAEQANEEYTGKTAETAGGVAAAWAGGKIGAAVGAAIGVWFGGVGAGPGAIIGGLLGSIGAGVLYYMTDASKWVNKIGQSFSKWWQSWTFKGVWDSIGKTLGSTFTTISDWVEDSWKTVKQKFSNLNPMSWFGDDKPTTTNGKPRSAPSAPAGATVTVTGKLPEGLKAFDGALAVSLSSAGNAITFTANAKGILTSAFVDALKSAQGGAGPLGTTSVRPGDFYDPKAKKGKAFTENDLIEYGKGDPIIFALGKLTKETAEGVEVMRSLATKMGAVVSANSDSVRYLKKIGNNF